MEISSKTVVLDPIILYSIHPLAMKFSAKHLQGIKQSRAERVACSIRFLSVAARGRMNELWNYFHRKWVELQKLLLMMRRKQKTVWMWALSTCGSSHHVVCDNSKTWNVIKLVETHAEIVVSHFNAFGVQFFLFPRPNHRFLSTIAAQMLAKCFLHNFPRVPTEVLPDRAGCKQAKSMCVEALAAAVLTKSFSVFKIIFYITGKNNS